MTALTGIHRALARTRDDLESEVVARARELTLTYDRLAHEAGQQGAHETLDRTLSERARHAKNLESVGTLAGGIAHDFNNILTSIIGYTDLAERRVTSEGPVKSYLSQVSAASLRAKGLVEQILTFSRRVELERRPMEVEPVLREVVALIRPALPASVRMTVDVEEGCSPIRGDGTQIHQLLMNLATNAHQALEDAGGRLGFHLSAAHAEGPFDLEHPGLRGRPCVRIEVSDTGPGIDPSTRSRLFEPFFTTRTKGQGTGLGLSVVHGIVLAHEGGVCVESEPGKGSSFVVYLPVAAQGEAVPVRGRPPPQSGSERLLVVDDEASIAELLETSLGALGYQVAAFTDPREALATFEAAPADWDVVITDEAMPFMTGLELAARLTALRPDLPVIVQTGLRAGPLSTHLPAGIVGVLQKPVTAAELTAAIRRALDGPGRSVAS